MKFKVKNTQEASVVKNKSLKPKATIKKSTPSTDRKPDLKDNKELSLILEREKEVLSNNLNLQRVLDKAIAIQKNCEDEYVQLKDLSVSPKNLMLIGASKNLRFTDHSFGQFCSKLGIPTQYMRKCAENEDTLPLISQNVGRWIEHNKDSKMFARMYGYTLRGFLSDKYSVMDAPDILNALDEVIDFKDFSLKGSLVTPERLHLRMTHLDNMKVKGEDLFAGIQVDSSDVGRNTLIVQFFIYKQVCTNGLVIPKFGGEIFRQKHIGIRPEQFVASLKDSLKVLPDLVANATQIINTSKNSLVTKEALESVIVPQIIKDTGLHEEKYTAKIIDLVGTKYKSTNWGVVNAITEVAQDFTLDTRLDLEKYASKWLVS